MLPSFKKLHFQKNWFTALFTIFNKTVVDPEGGQPVFYFKMNWNNGYQVYRDQSKQDLLLDLRWNRKVGIWAWDVFAGEKKVGTIKSDILQTTLSLGTEKWIIADEEGRPILTLGAESEAALKHVFDNMTQFYNPTHTYTLKNLKDDPVAYIAMKHGIFGSFYDFSFVKGTEQERQLALALFVAILMMMRK